MTQHPPSGLSPPEQPNSPNVQQTNNLNDLDLNVRENTGQAIAQMQQSKAVSVGNGNYIEKYYASDQPQGEPPKSKNIPTLLPYLANRSQQEYALIEFLGSLKSTQFRRPIVILIHGDEVQCHLKFLERLKERSLPKLLGNSYSLTAENNKVAEKLLEWPSEDSHPKNLSTHLKMNLADTILHTPNASLDEINQYFADYPGTIMVSTTLLTSDWETNKLKPLETLLNFWQTWPILRAGQRLIVCISIKYKLARPAHKEKFGWCWFFNIWWHWRGFCRRRYYQKLNRKISAEIKQLELSNFQRYESLLGLVLPRLTNISRNQVENWVRKEARDFVGEARLQNILNEIREIYDNLSLRSNDNEVTLPMEELADRLTKLLKNH